MNNAFMMLLAAITRARWAAAEQLLQHRVERHDEEAAEHPSISSASGAGRHPAGRAPPTASGASRPQAGRRGESQIEPNRVSPMEPKGTRPISMCPPENFSHSSEPSPMPTVKARPAASPCPRRRR